MQILPSRPIGTALAVPNGMIESVLAPIAFAVIVLAVLVYAGIRRFRRAASADADDRDARRRTGTDG